MSFWKRIVGFADDAGKPVGLVAALIGLFGSAVVAFQYIQQSRNIDLTGYWRLIDTFVPPNNDRVVIEFLINFQEGDEAGQYVGKGQKICVNGTDAQRSERSRILIQASTSRDAVVASFEENLRPHDPVKGDFSWKLREEGVLEGEIVSDDGSRGHSLLSGQVDNDDTC